MHCRPRNVFVLMALALLASPVGLRAETFHVFPDGKSGFGTIQAAVDATRDGDTVVLEPGTYSGPGQCDVDLRGKAITIRGTEPENPDVVAATVVDCQGSGKVTQRGFYVVGSKGATISGLTITNGLADAGGAVYCESSDLTLSHCRIIGNATLASGTGGGVCSVASTLGLEGCEIRGNAAGDAIDAPDGWADSGGDGGGVYAVSSVVYVSDCTVADNTAGAGGNSPFGPGRGGQGGGIYADSLRLARSTVIDNSAGAGGSGMEGADGGSGGGVHCMRATINNCIIEGNVSGAGGDSTYGEKGIAGKGGDGAGLFCNDSLLMTGCLVAGNRCGDSGLGLGSSLAGMNATGGGIWCSLGTIDHCTIVSNVAGQQTLSVIGNLASSVQSGGGLLCSSQTGVTNCIVWDNTPDQIFGADCSNVAYCDIETTDCPADQGSFSADPAFVQPGAWTDSGTVWVSGDYHLTADSPCVDAGDPDYDADPNATDLGGGPRLAGEATDIGAYELQGAAPVYRFWSIQTNRHFYTIDEAERALLQKQPETWAFEGTAYMAYASPSDPDLRPVYRFWSERLSAHFWTISEAEKDLLVDKYADSWTYEGPVFYAWPEGSQHAEAKPVYRFWSNSLSTHFYTIDESEKDLLVKEQADAWTYEGIVWYALEAKSNGGQPPMPQPDASEYEFASERIAATCGIELKAYFDGQEVRIDNPSIDLSAPVGRMQMSVDFATMTTSLTEFQAMTDLVQHTAVVTDSDGTGAEFPLTLVLLGTFDTETPRGPFAVDPQSLAFSALVGGDASVGDEIFHVVGSAVFEGQKYDVNLMLAPTAFETSGQGVFDDSGYPDRLDVSLDGPFQWRRQGQEQLLLEANLKGHVLQVYVSSAHVRATGLWLGKNLATDEVKKEK